MSTTCSIVEWADYLGDPPLAMALLDRVVDGAIIQRFKGKSYRAYRAEQQAARSGKRSASKTASTNSRKS